MGYTEVLFSPGENRVSEERRLTAIMFTDLVGYTTIMGRDQGEARALVERSRAHIRRFVERFHGQWLEEPGDSTLSIFPSAVDATDCAVAIQDSLHSDAELQLRIGLHLGDVVFADGRVYGDGVNVAARIEPLARPGGILITENIRDAIRGHPEVKSRYLGRKRLKNVAEAVRVYTLEDTSQSSPSRNTSGPPAWLVWLKRCGYAVAGVCVLGVLVWQGWLFYGNQNPAAGTGPATLAVLPFVNVSGDPDQEYFSDGLTEELINTLAGVEGLRVSSRTASFAFKEKEASVSVREIADKLDVERVLEGSVRKVGDEVRISVQLIDGENGYVLWQQPYQRTLENVLALQSDIAQDVAKQLDVVMTAGAEEILNKQPTENVPAYNFYLQGLDYLRRPPTEKDLAYAESLFHEALKLDPEYARAYAGLCQVALGRYRLNNNPNYVDQGEESCRTALQLDNSLDAVRVALGGLYYQTGRLDEAAAIYRDVLQSSPRAAAALVGLGQTLAAQGRLEEAEAAYRKAIQLQPGDWTSLMALGEFLYWHWRFEEAAGVFERVSSLTPDNTEALSFLGASYVATGRVEASVEAYRRANALTPSRSVYRNLGLINLNQGDYNAAIEQLRQAVELGPEDHWSWGVLADALWYSGKRQQAEQAFEKAAVLARAVLQRNPKDWPTMATLAIYTARLGEPEQALELAQAAIAGNPKSPEVMVYGAAVDLLLGREEEALDKLEWAVAHGYPRPYLARELRFEPLHSDSRFQSLIVRLD